MLKTATVAFVTIMLAGVLVGPRSTVMTTATVTTPITVTVPELRIAMKGTETLL